MAVRAGLSSAEGLGQGGGSCVETKGGVAGQVIKGTRGINEGKQGKPRDSKVPPPAGSLPAACGVNCGWGSGGEVPGSPHPSASGKIQTGSGRDYAAIRGCSQPDDMSLLHCKEHG